MDERQQPLRAIRATFDGGSARREAQHGCHVVRFAIVRFTIRALSWDTFKPEDQVARTGRFPCPPCGVFAGIAAISRFQNSRLGLSGPLCTGDIVCILRCWSWCARTLELDARCADFRGSPGPICREPRTTAHYVLGGCRSIFVHRISTSIDRLCRLYAALAQPVEHVIRNDGVACSSHASGTIVFYGAAQSR